MNLTVGKCSVQIVTEAKTYTIPFVGTGRAWQFEEMTFFGSGKFGQTKATYTPARDYAERFIFSLKEKGGAILEDQWVDYDRMTSISIIDGDDTHSITVGVEQIPCSD